MHKTTLHLDPDVLQKLRHYLADNGGSITNFVNVAVKEKLDKKGGEKKN